MLDILKAILEIQDLDMKMIRLMRLKRDRQQEVESIRGLREELRHQLAAKELEISDLKRQGNQGEARIQEVAAKIKRLESQQLSLKKAEEFSAITSEINGAERDRQSQETALSELLDRITVEEEILEKIKKSMQASAENSEVLEAEIEESVRRLNQEGRELLGQREALVKDAPRDLLGIYEKLLHNKRDRVVVPIENRSCAGCHIVLTPQHENLVRKGDRLVFCEHCSRILFWEEPAVEDAGATAKKRRRRTTAASS
ncbi:MAG: zinc ribbon domain regulatory protein CdsZ [Chlamydiia bacterium]